MKATLYMVLLLAAPMFPGAARADATFKEGVGITLDERTSAAIALRIAEVEERPLSGAVQLVAQVYRAADEAAASVSEPPGSAYASAQAAPADAAHFTPGATVVVEGRATATGRVVRIDRTMTAADGHEDVLLEIPDPDGTWRLGDFARVTRPAADAAEALVIPASAVLETAYGTFAYVRNGAALFRTPIRVGARDGQQVEILDGLYSGDEVATHPVETLYLIELRATKGGGHSH